MEHGLALVLRGSRPQAGQGGLEAALDQLAEPVWQRGDGVWRGAGDGERPLHGRAAGGFRLVPSGHRGEAGERGEIGLAGGTVGHVGLHARPIGLGAETAGVVGQGGDITGRASGHGHGVRAW